MKVGRSYKVMRDGKSIIRRYTDIRRDEIADEYFAPSYDSMPPLYQPAVDYIVELERLLWVASGTDMRTVWMSRLTGEPVQE